MHLVPKHLLTPSVIDAEIQRSSHLVAREGASLRLWNLLWPAKWLIVGCGALCALAALLFSLSKAPNYRAKTSIEVQDFNNNFLQLAELAPVNQGRDGTEAPVQSEVEKLRSKTVIARVVSRLHLDQAFEAERAKPDVLENFRLAVISPGLRAETPKERAVDEVLKNLDVYPSRNSSRIVTIEYSSKDPVLAAQLTNAVAQEYIDQGIELRVQAAAHLNQWLTREADQMRNKLQASENSLQKYGQTSGLLFTDEKNSVAEAKLKQLQEELSRAQADRITKQSRYELISQSSPETLAQVVGSGPIHEYEVKLTDARQQLAQAQALYMPNHPKVKQVQAEVDELSEAFERARKQIVNQVVSEHGAAKRREDLLQQAFLRQASLVSTQDSKASQYNILKAEVESNRSLYDSMLQKVKNVSIASALHTSNIAVFDPAQVPTAPFEPKPLFNAALGLLSGSLLASFYVFLRKSWDRRIQDPGDVEAFLNIPELGMVPAIVPGSTWRNKARSSALSLTAGEDRDSQRDTDGWTTSDHFLKSSSGPDLAGVVADSFRGIVASLSFSVSNDRTSRVIVVTSPSPREGKTVTVTNLGVTLASVGKRVVLVDGDLLRPRLHKIFSLNNSAGLSDLLTGTVDLAKDSLHPYIKVVEIGGISVLTAGSRLAEASKLLYTHRLHDLFTRLRTEFDVILVDTPPILALADARILSRHAEGVVLVCRAGSTERDAVKVAVDRLYADKIKIVGTILNAFDTRRRDYYKRYYVSYEPETVTVK